MYPIFVPPLICVATHIACIVVFALCLLSSGILSGSIIGSIISIDRAHDSETEYCSSKYTYDCIVTHIDKDSSNYDITLTCYKNNNLDGYYYFNLNSNEIIKYNISLYDPIKGYKDCEGCDSNDDRKCDYYTLYLDRQHNSYNLAGYATLAAVCLLSSIISTIATIILSIIEIALTFFNICVIPGGILFVCILFMTICIVDEEFKEINRIILILILSIIVILCILLLGPILLPIICCITIYKYQYNSENDIETQSFSNNESDIEIAETQSFSNNESEESEISTEESEISSEIGLSNSIRLKDFIDSNHEL